MKYSHSFEIGGRQISLASPTYFIADIASSHDGQLERAKSLIWLAKEAGADCVKFQHFKAEKIVSDHGFKSLGGQASHQAKWKSSVFDVFKKYEFDRSWNQALAEEARAAKIEFMTTPYDYEAVEEIDALVSAYKIGSGDITWTDFLRYVAKKQKPMILATGASSIEDVTRAVDEIVAQNKNIALLQCNTNYTGSLENFKYVNLSVLRSFSLIYPNMILGLSDHTPGHSTVLGAVALGARVIEKHFTDDNNREGPDHGFSMNPESWKEMVGRTRELQNAMGDSIKRVEANEVETAVLQRRCLRAARDLAVGEELSEELLEALRPAPASSVPPYMLKKLIGKKLSRGLKKGEAVNLEDVD